eukprot:432991_1
MASNDLIEGLIAAHKYYDYKQCGNLLSFKRNETLQNISNNDDLYDMAESKLFNDMDSYRTLIEKDKQEKINDEKNALKLKMKHTDDLRKQKLKSQQRLKDLYNKYCNLSFGESEEGLIALMNEEMKIYKDKYNKKVNFMMDRIRVFKYCLEDKNIKINSYNRELGQIQRDVIKKCEEYNVWGDNEDEQSFDNQKLRVWESITAPKKR